LRYQAFNFLKLKTNEADAGFGSAPLKVISLFRPFGQSRRLDHMSRIEKAALWAASITALVVFLPLHRANPGRAKLVAATAQIRAYPTAVENYKKDTGDYPATSQGLNALRTNPGTAGWNGPYVDKDIVPDPWGHPYVYRYRPGAVPEVVSLGRDGVLDSKKK
jgi:type II secretion system protein G